MEVNFLVGGLSLVGLGDRRNACPASFFVDVEGIFLLAKPRPLGCLPNDLISHMGAELVGELERLADAGRALGSGSRLSFTFSSSRRG